MAHMEDGDDDTVREWLISLSNKTWHTEPDLLPGNEKEGYIRVFHRSFATSSLRSAVLLLLLITFWVIYIVIVLVVKDLWKAHRELTVSLGLDKLSLPKFSCFSNFFSTRQLSITSGDYYELW